MKKLDYVIIATKSNDTSMSQVNGRFVQSLKRLYGADLHEHLIGVSTFSDGVDSSEKLSSTFVDFKVNNASLWSKRKDNIAQSYYELTSTNLYQLANHIRSQDSVPINLLVSKRTLH